MRALNNTGQGIWVAGSGNTVTGNTASGNLNGITVESSGSTVSGNTASGCAGAHNLPAFPEGGRRVMTAEEAGFHRAIFIVRLDRDEFGQITGVVERVRTGEKALVDALADAGQVLAAMLSREATDQDTKR
jgi:parallel beta-helix repeat protein